MRARVVTEYTFASPKIQRPRAFLVVSDLHNCRFDDLLSLCARAEAVLIPGDMIHWYPEQYEIGLDFLRSVAMRVPTYYTYGNHEDLCDQTFDEEARKTGAILLNNAYCRDGELVIGGLHVYDKPRLFKRHDRKDIGDGLVGEANRMLDAMEREAGYRLLLCHKPEHFVRFVLDRAVELTVSGHAHGGQVRLWGRGLYAPNQGILPSLTRGRYEGGRLLVSAGASNTNVIPRWGNPCEVLRLCLLPE